MKLINVSGTTSLVTVQLAKGTTEYYRLWLRNDGVVVALPMTEKPDEDSQ